MANLINIQDKPSQGFLYAEEFNEMVDTINEAIAEQNQTKATHEQAIVANGTALANKVDKVAGKGLSEKDYTNGEKSKLENIAAGATNDTGATIKAKLEALEGDARLDAGAIKGFGGASATQVEWVEGDPKPELQCDEVTGEFREGFKHLVSYTTDADGNIIANIQLLNYEKRIFLLKGSVPDIISGAFDSNNRFYSLVGSFYGGSGMLNRYLYDGTIDSSFHFAHAGLATPKKVLIDSEDRIYVLSLGYGLTCYNLDGSIDDNFASPATGLTDFAFDGQGRIYMFYNGAIRRMLYDGSNNELFFDLTPATYSGYQFLDVDYDGNVYIGKGSAYIRRILQNKALDDSLSSSIYMLEAPILRCLSDGCFLVAGAKQSLPYFPKFNFDFSLNVEHNNYGPLDGNYMKKISGFVLDSEGRIYAWGQDKFYRLLSDGNIDESYGRINEPIGNPFKMQVFCDYNSDFHIIYAPYVGDGILTRRHDDGSQYDTIIISAIDDFAAELQNVIDAQNVQISQLISTVEYLLQYRLQAAALFVGKYTGVFDPAASYVVESGLLRQYSGPV